MHILAILAQDLAEDQPSHKRSIMELHGLGKDDWHGIDAQEYVNKLREEWEHRL